MFFELTDLLTCPRCGPAHGLVLLVQELQDRRVRSGWLGCPNCRADYPVREGVADLRLDHEAEPAAAGRYDEDELTLRILALSGLAGRQGTLVLDDRLAHAAASLAESAPELEVVAVGAPDAARGVRPGVNHVLCDAGWPLADYRCQCVAIAPGGVAERVTAAGRLVAAGGRLLLFDAGEADIEAAERSGLKLVAAEGGTAVAERAASSLPIIG